MKKPFFKINIYEPEHKKEKTLKSASEYSFIGLFTFLSFLLLLFVILFIFFALYLPQNSALEDTNAQINVLEKKLQALNSISKDINNKKEIYLNIKSESTIWLDKIATLGKSLPDNIWISKLDFSGRNGEKKGGQKLLVSGFTFSGFKEENLDQIGILLASLNHSSEYRQDFSPLHLDLTQKSEKDWGITMFQYSAITKDLISETDAQ